MPRIPRMVINDETTVYHVMSRSALDGFPLGDIEKDFMLDLIKRYSALYLRNSMSKAKKSVSEGIADMCMKPGL